MPHCIAGVLFYYEPSSVNCYDSVCSVEITTTELSFTNVLPQSNKIKLVCVFQRWDPTISGLNLSVSSERSVREWTELQDGQHILITTPSVLLGYRLKVYRAEGTTQWYTAVTTGYNESKNVRYLVAFLSTWVLEAPT